MNLKKIKSSSWRMQLRILTVCKNVCTGVVRAMCTFVCVCLGAEWGGDYIVQDEPSVTKNCGDAVSHDQEHYTKSHYCWLINLPQQVLTPCVWTSIFQCVLGWSISLLYNGWNRSCAPCLNTHSKSYKKKAPANEPNDWNIMYTQFVHVERVKSQAHINGLACVHNSCQIGLW